MKITIKGKKSEEFAYDALKPGTVYQIDTGPTLLKLSGNDAVILKFTSGQEWLGLALPGESNFKGCPATKILGKLVEIVVEEQS